YLDRVFQPFTWALGIPAELGTPLIFGIFRKELSLLMLAQAFGTTNFASVLTPEQMVTFTVFVVFYIPCLATMITIKNELGWKNMVLISGLSVVVALLAALFLRLLFLVF
ncbi:MAG: hypothetical protein MUO42_07560, partial [Anaerolineaceae bacterium]|nr:hypothetical protein [Anaerolineaceae bacterium]